jgi:hypothetical protein
MATPEIGISSGWVMNRRSSGIIDRLAFHLWSIRNCAEWERKRLWRKSNADDFLLSDQLHHSWSAARRSNVHWNGFKQLRQTIICVASWDSISTIRPVIRHIWLLARWHTCIAGTLQPWLLPQSQHLRLLLVNVHQEQFQGVRGVNRNDLKNEVMPFWRCWECRVPWPAYKWEWSFSMGVERNALNSM